MLMPWDLEEAANLILEDGMKLGETSIGRELLQLGKEAMERDAKRHEGNASIGEVFIARKEDMSLEGRVRLFKQPDGDMCLTVIDGNGNQAGVEFCSIGSGGGRSPHTMQALYQLALAIRADNEEEPSRRAER